MVLSHPQRALITGASSGIGKETAIAFAKSGIHLILVGRSLERLEAVAEQARQLGVDAESHAVDLAQVAEVKSKIEAIATTGAPVDVLVNNAGMGYTGDVRSTSLQDWQQVMDLNVTSVLQCIQAVLPTMRDRGTGTIVNVASIAGYHAFPGWGAYNVSKAALISLSKTLAAEERSHGIRVTVVSPGAVNTPIWDTETVQVELNRAAMLTPEIVAQSILHAVLLPSQAVIEELILTPSAGAL
jgi:short-subunit dehydrogenase